MRADQTSSANLANIVMVTALTDRVQWHHK